MAARENLGQPSHVDAASAPNAVIGFDTQEVEHVPVTLKPSSILKLQFFKLNPFVGAGMTAAVSALLYSVYAGRKYPKDLLLTARFINIKIGAVFFSLSAFMLGEYYYRMKNYRVEKAKALLTNNTEFFEN